MTIYTDALKSRGPSQYQEPTGFAENYSKSLGTTVESGMSISRAVVSGFITSPYRKRRNEQIDQMIANGDIPEQYGDALDGHMSYNDVAIIARDKFGQTIKSDEDIDNVVREDLKRNVESAGDVFSRATLMGKVGIVAGAPNAAMLDPPSIIGSFIGLGAAAKGATVLSRAAKAAALGAGATMAEEAVIQPFVYSWKQDVGLDYSTGDAFKAIAYAGAGGGILAGAAKTAGEFVTANTKFLQSHDVARVKNKNEVNRQSYDNVQNAVDEAKQLPPDTDIKAHFDEVDTTIRNRDNAAPSTKFEVDVGDRADEVLDGTFKAQTEESVFVKEVIDEGGGKKFVETGDAAMEVDAISKQIDDLKKFGDCINGV